ATAFLATSSMVNATAAGTGAMAGGHTGGVFGTKEPSLVLRWHSESGARQLDHRDATRPGVFGSLPTAVRRYAVDRLRHVQEEGEVHERVVLTHLRRGARRTLRNLSTVAGLRANTDYPLDTLITSPANGDARGNDAPVSRPEADGHADNGRREP